MANSKISALTSATTPLAGTETLPIVQSGATVKVTVANLTAGRAVSASSLTSSSAAINGTTAIGGATFEGLAIRDTNTTVDRLRVGYGDITTGQIPAQIKTSASALFIYSRDIVGSSINFATGSGLTTTLGFTATNLTLTNANIVQGTAAKGFDFSANTPLAGKTSTILNWYEEGTWTPNQGAGLTLVGAFSSTGRYTRIGRQVSISGTVTGATSVAVTAAGVITSNLPFTVVTAGHGGATNVANNASATVICTSTNVTSASAIAATATITFSATYFV